MEATANTEHQPAQFQFSGTTGEYFRIWIVNLALTIVTLGIYSAWATVRKRRYFYTHTSLADGHFDYHATPLAILVGRIIAIGLLAVYYFSSYADPRAPLAIVVAIFMAVPWFIVRSRRFRLRVTSYRNVRFNFTGSFADAFKTYYVAALISVFSLGFATARANHYRTEFNVRNSAFGKTNFSFGGDLGTFYKCFWASVGLTILVVIAYGGLITVIMTMLAQDPASVAAAWAEILAMLMLLAGYVAVGVYYQVRMRNHVYSTTMLGNSSIHSDLKVGRMLGLYASNFLAIVFTLGLATPWAQIRMARYRAECTSVILADDWESHLAATTDAGSAIGEEMGEAFDVDVGLGF